MTLKSQIRSQAFLLTKFFLAVEKKSNSKTLYKLNRITVLFLKRKTKIHLNKDNNQNAN